MSGWNLDTNAEKKEFTKFAPGVTEIRILSDAPHQRWVHWLPQHRRTVNCIGKGCPICEIRQQQKANGENYTYSLTRRFAMNVENLDTGNFEIMEQGITFIQDLKDLREDILDKGLNLYDVIIKVRRRGTGKDNTSYRLDIDREDVLSDTEIREKSQNITDLDEYFITNTPEQVIRLINGESWEDVIINENNEEEDVEEFELE